jgi:hypothetical protein
MFSVCPNKPSKFRIIAIIKSFVKQNIGSIKTNMHVHGLILLDSLLAAAQRFMLCAHKNKYEFKHLNILLVRMLGFSQKLLKFD